MTVAPAKTMKPHYEFKMTAKGKITTTTSPIVQTAIAGPLRQWLGDAVPYPSLMDAALLMPDSSNQDRAGPNMLA